MNILIMGGSGFIGQAFTREAVKAGHQVTILTRNPAKIEQREGISAARWDGMTPNGWQNEVETADAVINLVGENIGDKPWTAERKQAILQSRVRAGKTAVAAIQMSSHRPRVFIQASAVGYYGPGDDSVIEETHPAGNDFLGHICLEWEASTRELEGMGIRRAVIRTGLVLTPSGGPLGRLLTPFRLFAGGPLGGGQQWWPWIHPQDEVGAMLFLLENEKAAGAFNLTAPEPVRMADFGRTLAAVIHRPYWFPVPALGLKLILGEMSKIVLEGQRAIPKRLLELGYTFKYPALEPALKQLLTS